MNQTKEIKALKQIEAVCCNTEAELKKVGVFVWVCRIVGWVGIFFGT